jgi:hypothetical protein
VKNVVEFRGSTIPARKEVLKRLPAESREIPGGGHMICHGPELSSQPSLTLKKSGLYSGAI